ncbi:Hypothetical protein NTJ_02546 [Nesidiocoris tenuis]|uniref:THAP-type domain-containing protein n=1 Tax=Nesidiocoris tenuis TaxID=355587 RepID=A0ABN7ABP7_9HEMI|nr:Hypothetical protein NTJ_02546 [Nesidiocoris tenuis]
MSERSCCVVGCKTTKTRNPTVTLHSFPGKPYEKDRRQKWITAVNRLNADGSPWQPSRHSEVCSLHFVGGKVSNIQNHPAYIPSIFPKNYRKPQLTIGQEQRQISRFNRWLKRKSSKAAPPPAEDQSSSDDLQLPVDEEPTSASCAVQVYLGKSPGDCLQLVCDRISDTCVAIQCELPQTLRFQPIGRADVSCGPSNLSEICGGFYGQTSVKDERELRSLCGVGREAFDYFSSLLTSPISVSLTNDHVLLLFFMKLKLGISFTALGVLLNIHQTTAFNLFVATLEVLASRTAEIVWPDKFAVKKVLPACFRGTKYEDARVIINCMAIPAEQPKHIEDRISMYSNCKNGYAYKFLIGMTPLGTISFKSRVYGGRSSDAYIVDNCGFMQMLEPGDVVLADQEFPRIQSSHTNGATILVIPPVLTSGRPTDDELAGTEEISPIGIHVERCVGRIKMFRLLDKIPRCLFSHIDDIVHICCVLVNHMNPLVKVPTIEEDDDDDGI